MLKYTIHIISSILILFIIGCKKDSVSSIQETEQELNIENFSFSSDETNINGKIYLPEYFSKDKNLPAIYLIDFVEHGFSVALDEFEKVIDAVNQIPEFDAVVVTLEEHLDVETGNGDFEIYYRIFKNMASYVYDNYTNNSSRTFVGRGIEAGLVLTTLFLEDPASSIFENFVATDSPNYSNWDIISVIDENNFPQNKGNKKLHFSFSSTNDRPSCTSLINKINDENYTWLQFESREYAGEFTNTYPTAFEEGIKYVFNK